MATQAEIDAQVAKTNAAIADYIAKSEASKNADRALQAQHKVVDDIVLKMDGMPTTDPQYAALNAQYLAAKTRVADLVAAWDEAGRISLAASGVVDTEKATLLAMFNGDRDKATAALRGEVPPPAPTPPPEPTPEPAPQQVQFENPPNTTSTTKSVTDPDTGIVTTTTTVTTKNADGTTTVSETVATKKPTDTPAAATPETQTPAVDPKTTDKTTPTTLGETPTAKTPPPAQTADGNTPGPDGPPRDNPVRKHNQAFEFFFTETYDQLPKLRLAPDLLVYINRTRTLRTWLGDTFDLNDWLTTANGGSGMDRQHMCTLNFYIPRHLESYFVGMGGRFVLRPFYEVEVYAKGRFLADDTGSDLHSEEDLYGGNLDTNSHTIPTSRFYRIFWGWVSSITSEWQEGDYQIIVTCSPILRVFELTHLRNNLTVTGPVDKTDDINPWANPGLQANPLQVILTVYGTLVTPATEFNEANPAMDSSPTAKAMWAGSVGNAPATPYRQAANRALMTWNNRIKEIQKRTTFFGLGYKEHISGQSTPPAATSTPNTANPQAGTTPPPSNPSYVVPVSKKRDLKASNAKLTKLNTQIADTETKKDDAEKKVTDLVERLRSQKPAGDDLKVAYDTLLPMASDPTSGIKAPDLAKLTSDKPFPIPEPWLAKISEALTTKTVKPLADQLDKLTADLNTETGTNNALQQEIAAIQSGKPVPPPTPPPTPPNTENPDKSKTAAAQEPKVTVAQELTGNASKGRGITFYEILSKATTESILKGDVISNPQDPKCGTYPLFLQDWAIASYLPYNQIGNFEMFTLDENKRRLDVLAEMADAICYEFYQDLNGNVIFKPPFYNMDTRPDTVFNINDIDILSEQVVEDETQIKLTNLKVRGPVAGEVILCNGSPLISPTAQWIDLRGIAKYGQRTQVITKTMIKTSEQAYIYAISEQTKANRFSTRINIQIPARPELMLGFPVYLQGRDCFGYLERVQWSYTAGSDFTFQLELSAIRRRIYIHEDRLKDLKAARPPTDGSLPKPAPAAPPSTVKNPAADPAPNATPNTDGKKFVKVWPLPTKPYVNDSTSISCPFKDIKSHSSPHKGIDCRTRADDLPLVATIDGTLSTLGTLNGGAYYAVLQGIDGSTHTFAHMLSVEKSGNVKAGDPIGRSGGGPKTIALLQSKGVPLADIKKHTTGSHLHWQVKMPSAIPGSSPLNANGLYVDPMAWLKYQPT